MITLLTIISVILSIISIIIGAIALSKNITGNIRTKEITLIITDTLHGIRKGSDKLITTIKSKKLLNNSKTINKPALEFRNNIERHIRRSALYTQNNELITKSLAWFKDNAIIDDRIFIERALKYKCIHGKNNKEIARFILIQLDKKLE